MKRIFNIIAVITAILATSCIKDDYTKEYNNDFKTNYEAFWNYINENYGYLGESYGYSKNVDWHSVYEEMMPQAENAATEAELLEIMGKSIDYLKDGHVWLDTKFKHRGCFTFYIDDNGERYPDNFIKGVIEEKYLDEAFRTRNGHRYGMITRENKTFFYLHHDDFIKDINNEDLEMFQPIIAKADGIIYDIRTNPGGSAQLSLGIAQKFVKEKTLVGYHIVKNSKEYNDFSEPSPLYILPSDADAERNWADKKTMVLTNRDVYSAANMFAAFMKEAPNVTLVGGKTGGGGGLPCTYYLPNGWAVTMSAQRFTLDVDKKHIEPGVEPDIYVTITEEDIENKVDSILEKAIEVLSE